MSDDDLGWEDQDFDDFLEEEKKPEPKPEPKKEPKKEKKEPKKDKKKEKVQTAPVKNDKKKGRAKEGMFKDLQEKIDEMKLTEDLFQSEQIRIELLQPKTQKDFEAFSEILSDKIKESEDQKKFYVNLLKDLITGCTENLKSSEIREIQTHVSNLAQKRLDEEKNLKNPQPKKASKLKIDSEKDVDPFQLDKIAQSEQADDEEFGDDDFM
eukprot:gene4766-8348_t